VFVWIDVVSEGAGNSVQHLGAFRVSLDGFVGDLGGDLSRTFL